MKKLLLLVSIIFLLTSCSVNLDDNYEVDIKNSESCNNEVEKYYSNKEQTIYLVCIDEINLKDTNNNVSLKKYLKQKNTTINDTINNIIAKVIGDVNFFDGSAVMYDDGGTYKYSKNGYTIITCNTSIGNKDIYIGTDELKLQDDTINGYCGNK